MKAYLSGPIENAENASVVSSKTVASGSVRMPIKLESLERQTPSFAPNAFAILMPES